MVRELSRVSFASVVLGRPPITYQWFGDGVEISGATNRVLTYDPLTGLEPINYHVVVNTGAGSTTSQTAELTQTVENHPVTSPGFTLSGFAGAPLTLPLSTILQTASDPDGDSFAITGFEGTGTNLTNPGQISQAGAALVYSNATGLVGADLFHVTLTDALSDVSTVAVVVQLGVLQLRIGRDASPGTVRISWPAAATIQGFRLVSTDLVTGPVTNPVSATVLTTGAESAVTVTPASAVQYYRLAYP
jgi:hypothetical protein